MAQGVAQVRSLPLFVMLLMMPPTIGCGPSDEVSVASPTDNNSPAAASPSPKPDVQDIAANVEPPPAADEPAQPTNHLAGETSPYLLLHVHNPVDWYPWGPEALDKARREGKPIFLSIGYSSCYWCHVMERESFMDKEIAAMLNEHFVCIKVDREERPDIDEIFMTALQIYFQAIRSSQGGGWPLTMFLTPEGLPMMGGTYFPPRDSQRGTGLLSVLRRVQDRWQQHPKRLRESAQQLADFVRDSLDQRQPALDKPLGKAWLDELTSDLDDTFDTEFGGFGYSAANPQRPKFPEPSKLLFLLDRIERADDTRARVMLVTTLDAMAAGGIRDHLGGGFHRYSTDRFWNIPHFEKMLYDNGQLLSVYARAAKLLDEPRYAEVAHEIAHFVLAELTDPQGGFYTALDAETDADEGAYYAWSDEQLADVLSPQELAVFSAAYGIGPDPNFEERHALLLPRPLQETAAQLSMQPGQLREQLDKLRERLLQRRDERERPLRDTKVLTSWNGLMIRGLADAGRLLDEPRYVEAAARGARFVLESLRTPEGRLLRTWRDGKAKLNAYLDDYAFFVDGLIALHEATGGQQWLTAADELTQKQIALFHDERFGGFFFTSSDHEALLARSKDPVDSALPSGNAVAASNLLYLSRALDDDEYLAHARRTTSAFQSMMQDSPTLFPHMAITAAALAEIQESPAAKDSPQAVQESP